jgi:hypothetical protein
MVWQFSLNGSRRPQAVSRSKMNESQPKSYLVVKPHLHIRKLDYSHIDLLVSSDMAVSVLNAISENSEGAGQSPKSSEFLLLRRTDQIPWELYSTPDCRLKLQETIDREFKSETGESQIYG